VNWTAFIGEALSGMGKGRPVPLASRLVIADAVLADLARYRPSALPERPAVVPEDDNDVWAAMLRGQSARSSREDKRLAAKISEWRGDVARAEAWSAGNLGLLLDVLETFRSIEASGGLDGALEARRDELLAHIQRYWPAGELTEDGLLCRDRVDRQTTVARACRRKDVMPTWLLNGQRPPRYVPRAHAPSGKTEPPLPLQRRRAAPTGAGSDDEDTPADAAPQESVPRRARRRRLAGSS
jgi:hypothetical protein